MIGYHQGKRLEDGIDFYIIQIQLFILSSSQSFPDRLFPRWFTQIRIQVSSQITDQALLQL